MPLKKNSNWLVWSRLRQKSGLFGPDSVPPNQLQQMMATRKKSRPIFTGQLYLPSINRPYSLFIFMRYIAMFTE
jgi:hypothetical protein